MVTSVTSERGSEVDDNNVPNGKGLYHFSDGRMYEGAVSDGIPHGRGLMVEKEGNFYEGDFVRGEATGEGMTLSVDLSVFEGLGGRIEDG